MDPATRQLAHDVFKQLIEINSTDSIGSTTAVAEAMRQRLLDAGFAPTDVVILGTNPRKGNLVARLRGRPGSTLKPVLLLCHTDVVEATREVSQQLVSGRASARPRAREDSPHQHSAVDPDDLASDVTGIV